MLAVGCFMCSELTPAWLLEIGAAFEVTFDPIFRELGPTVEKPLPPLLGWLKRTDGGSFYVRGPLLKAGRKTPSVMANRLGGDERSIQRLVSRSRWDWTPLRRTPTGYDR